MLDMHAADNPSALAGMVNGVWLDAQQFPPLRYAVAGIIPEGLGVLVGPPKAGKSWLVANIGLAAAAGGKALGRIPVEQRPVLYLALEDGHRRLQSRFRRIMADGPIPAAMHVIIRAQSYYVIPMVTEFLALHHDRQPLVILDTLGRVKPPNRPGGDSYAQDYAIGASLKQAIDTTPGATLLVVHHSRKAESADFVDAVSGTQGIAGSADFVMVLARKRHCNDAVLAVTGRDISENEYAITTDGGLWSLDGADLAAAAGRARERRDEGKLSDRTLEVQMFVNGRTQTRAADLTALGIDQEQARVYLNRLADSGRIRKTGRGVYGPSVDPNQLTLPDDESSSVTTVPTVTSNESSQLEGGDSQAGNVAPLRPSVTSESVSRNPADGNVTVITDVTPIHPERPL
ncbi:MAG: hypothetical protein FGM52_06765 [Mycobacterium sp.]|nr:hypothetical protein [Mycobacterium sp.]